MRGRLIGEYIRGVDHNPTPNSEFMRTPTPKYQMAFTPHLAPDFFILLNYLYQSIYHEQKSGAYRRNYTYFKFSFSFWESLSINSVYEEHNTIYCREVIFPHSPRWNQHRIHLQYVLTSIQDWHVTRSPHLVTREVNDWLRALEKACNDWLIEYGLTSMRPSEDYTRLHRLNTIIS